MKRMTCLCLMLAVLFAACVSKPEATLLTLDHVVKLSEKGMSLSWKDLENFIHEDVGSGRYIWQFALAEPEYTLSLQGSSLQEPPAQMLLMNASGNSIDIRIDDVEAFLAEESPVDPVPEPEPEPAPEPMPEPVPEQDEPPPPAPSGGAGWSGSQPAQPTFRIEASPASYDATADFITIKITNRSQVEGGYGYAYRIEQKGKEDWEAVPLELEVMEIAAILPAGKTNTETFRLHKEQYEYQPGSYRIVLLDGLGGASAEFRLE